LWLYFKTIWIINKRQCITQACWRTFVKCANTKLLEHKVRLCLVVHYGQLRKAIPSRQKSPPLVPLGLHGLFVGFRTINPSVAFFCHTFCNPSVNGKIKSYFPTVTAIREYCPENHLWLLCVFTFWWKHKSHNRFSNGDIGHNPFFLAWHFEPRYPLKKMRCDRVW